MTPQHPDHWRRRLRLARPAVLALALLALPAMAPDAGPHIVSLSGGVELGRGEPPAWRPAQAGDALAAGDVVRTAHDGRAELQLGTGRVRLYGDSLLRLPADGIGPGGASGVELEHGDSIFDVLRRGAEPFEVRTPEVVVSVKGTRFAVGVADQVLVSVYRGTVGVAALAQQLAQEMLVREGFAALGGSGRPFELFLHESTDPWEAWSPAAEPPPLPRGASRGAPDGGTAVAEARAVSRDASRPEALERALARRPELARRVARAAADRRAEPGGKELGPAALDPAAPDLAGSDTPVRDPAMDVSKHERMERVDMPFVEAWLATGGGNMDGSSGDAGGGGRDADEGMPFDVTFVSGSGTSGSDRILIEFYDGQSWTFEENTLEDVLKGEETLPPELVQALVDAGVSDVSTLVEMLVKLLDES